MVRIYEIRSQLFYFKSFEEIMCIYPTPPLEARFNAK